MRRLREAKKPVVASLGSVAASGGYYVAVAADRIYASPGTLTGSIGVVMQLANVEGLLKKVGVEYVVVKAGAFKDVGNFARPMTAEERRILQALLDDVYDQFIAAVADGRGLEAKDVRTFAEGRIYSGRQAQRLKMVDDLGGLEDAIEAAAKMADLDVGTMPVCDGERLVGLLTDRDITVRAVARGADPATTPVRDVMTASVRYNFDDEPVARAVETMKKHRIRRLPILDRAKRLAGIVSLGDLAVDAGIGRAGEVLQRVSEPARPRRWGG